MDIIVRNLSQAEQSKLYLRRKDQQRDLFERHISFRRLLFRQKTTQNEIIN